MYLVAVIDRCENHCFDRLNYRLTFLEGLLQARRASTILTRRLSLTSISFIISCCSFSNNIRASSATPSSTPWAVGAAHFWIVQKIENIPRLKNGLREYIVHIPQFVTF